MNWTDLRLRLRALIFKKHTENELQEELDFHLEMQTRKNLREGLDDDGAKRQAMKKFGSLQRFSEECRDERRINLIDSLIQDVCYAVRQFSHSRAFASVAVLSLGLGIGANTALFTVVDSLYFRQAPVSQPEELVSFRWRAFGESNNFIPKRVFGSLMSTSDSDTGVEYTTSTSFLRRTVDEFRRSDAIPAELFAFSRFQASADVRGWPQEVSAQLVSGNYFRALGVSTIAGRPLDPADDATAAEPAAVISDFVWEKLFNRDSSAIGEKVTINGLPVTIVGVTPRGFYLAGGTPPGFSLSMALANRVSRGAFAQPDLWWVRLMARKKPEATLEQIEASLQGVFQASILRETSTASSPSRKEQIPRLEALDGSRGFVEIAGSDRQETL